MSVAPLLQGLRVVELGSSIPAAYCGKVLAELGADVIKVEPPDGDILREQGPFVGTPSIDNSASFHYYAAGKRSVVVTPDDTDLVVRLQRWASVVLTDGGDGYPDPGEGWDGIHVVFTGLASESRSGYAVTDIVAYALGGYLYTDGAREREPLKGGGDQPEHAAANYAIMAILAAMLGRKRGAESGRIEIQVPLVECMATMHWYTTVMWTYASLVKQRIGNRLDITHPVSLYQCSDGWVAIGAGGNDAWAMLTAAMGEPDLASDPRFANGASRLAHADEVDAIITGFTSNLTRREVMKLLQELRVPCGLVSSPKDLLTDPQYEAREYWRDAGVPGRPGVRAPGAPFRSSDLPFRSAPAPRLGADTNVVLATLSRFGEVHG